MRAAQLEPIPAGQGHKKPRPAPRDAATSTSHSDNLELEYASSLIRVIRSRKDVDARARTHAISPVERPVPAADSIILLSGCDRFSLSARRAPAAKIALPEIAAVYSPVAAQESASSSDDSGGAPRWAERQRYSSKVCHSGAVEGVSHSRLGGREVL
jgi:hypothetical protein